ncbi:type II toxin-antitoxin system CcdA family antitoxin [Aliidiomarina quisquiliarum]|uniref:type II toxin-antitoxin system CcdA family antitoxin n=1 Tax=Aliidiomarina quisquiliarum TaxID=2938947 RepID=UPI00208FCD38|nr:type II toxin-antitoxin system CcdA family antitoxin [Aliidiomarina quisquiliarum]
MAVDFPAWVVESLDREAKQTSYGQIHLHTHNHAHILLLSEFLQLEATMAELYNITAPKKATNLSVNSDLLKKTRALNINLSATLERALKEELAKSKADQWVEENRTAIRNYNEFVEQHGCFGDEFREF